MLTITFTVEDLARTRLAVSPLWEIVASVRLLKNPRAQHFHRRWAEETGQRIAREKLELGLLFDLVDSRSWYTPDFLTALPAATVPDLAAELGALSRVPAEQVRADLDALAYARTHPVGSLAEAGLPRRLRRARAGELPSEAVVGLYDDPGAGVAVLVGQLQVYWEVALAPYWGRIRALLEGDLLYRARRLGQGGPAGLFSDLDESVRWKDGALRIRHRRFHGVRELAGEGLLLTPSAFVWPTVYSSTIPPWQPSLTYPARGVAGLWDTSVRRASAGVVGVLGRSRAEVLVQLDVARSTTELAERIGLTAGGVSQHLRALRAAGLVTGHRVGRVVLYARTSVAEGLLGAGEGGFGG